MLHPFSRRFNRSARTQATFTVGLGDPWIDSHRFCLLETMKWFGVWSKMSKVLIVFWDNQYHQIRLIVWSNMIFLTTSAATVGVWICEVAELSPSCGSAWKQQKFAEGTDGIHIWRNLGIDVLMTWKKWWTDVLGSGISPHKQSWKGNFNDFPSHRITFKGTAT